MAAVDPATLQIGLLIFAALVGVIIYVVSKLREFGNQEDKGHVAEVGVPARQVGGPAERIGGGIRRRGGARSAQSRIAAARERAGRNSESGESGEEWEREETPLLDRKIGTKKLRKLEMKAAAAEARVALEEEREERKQRSKLLEEKQKEREEAEAREEESRLKEEKRLREEKELQEYNEYLALKETFTLEDEGFSKTEDDDDNKLEQFITYIKKTKVVLMEDLAAEFGLKTQETIDRVRSLMESEQLSGVIDDRGKFIYISKEELLKVAKFIRQRGRVSLSELVEQSNRLINLTPEIV